MSGKGHSILKNRRSCSYSWTYFDSMVWKRKTAILESSLRGEDPGLKECTWTKRLKGEKSASHPVLLVSQRRNMLCCSLVILSNVNWITYFCSWRNTGESLLHEKKYSRVRLGKWSNSLNHHNSQLTCMVKMLSQTNLISFFELNWIDSGNCNGSKRNMVLHTIMILKMVLYSIDEASVKWILNESTSRIPKGVNNREISLNRGAASRNPQGLVLIPVLFNTFIDDLVINGKILILNISNDRVKPRICNQGAIDS